MDVILLEIDSSKKRMLLSKLSAVGLLAMRACKKEGGGVNVSASDAGSLSLYRERIEIYAEKYSMSKIVKTIVKLARDGFLLKSPVKVISIRSAN